jgi:hypothetical protein
VSSEWSIALIGNASVREDRGEDVDASRSIFDKETRRKLLAFAADAAWKLHESSVLLLTKPGAEASNPVNSSHIPSIRQH